MFSIFPIEDVNKRLDRIGKRFENLWSWSIDEYRPSINYREEGDMLHLDVTMPGYNKEEISVEIIGNSSIKVSANRSREGYVFNNSYMEMLDGFKDIVDFDTCEASYEAGILTLSMKKINGKNGVKRIEVK